ncbi:hypothetical protein AMTR_s00032p00227960 [Amborella trichopoda]|uniref:Thioesterase domain-containing protein n=1 Tax=Amborella trichopoda TaxID=13333 RepID=U5CXX1_AMBTC|nr:hypothetical protein AMTR_s00032p00227960 [Amborella trichopoda]
MTADSFTRSYLSGELKEVGFLINSPDSALKIFGFAVEIVSPEQVSGRFRVTETCCQPFKVLHGGVSALICEGLASMGAHVASGFRRTSGIELNINHLRAAPLGEYIFARAKPVISGRRVQEIHLASSSSFFE